MDVCGNRVTINRWDENGPESRIKLIGIFPGAKVMNDSDWYYDENEVFDTFFAFEYMGLKYNCISY